MSAFVVSKHDIDILVTAYMALRGAGPSPDAIGRMLWRENVSSVLHLYRGKSCAELRAMWPQLVEIDAYLFSPIFAKAAAVAKIARCYDYQSCEHDGWRESRSREIVERLMRVFPDDVPFYDDMPWGISDAADLARARV